MNRFVERRKKEKRRRKRDEMKKGVGIDKELIHVVEE